MIKKKNQKIKKYFLFTFFIIFLISFSGCSNSKITNKENKIPLKQINLNNLKEVKLQISDMTCEGCASGIEAVVGGLNGVESAKVNFETGIGIVKYDPAIISVEKIVNASNELYPTKVFEN